MVLVATTGVLPVFLAGAAAVQIRADLGFGEAGFGQAVSISFFVSALLSVLFGGLAERLGPVRSMRVAATVSAASMLATAAFSRSLTSLSLLLVGGGVANALTQPATNLYISRVFPAHRRGIAFAIKQSAIPGATLLGGLAVPTLALTVGWRWAYVAGAIIALIGGAIVQEVAQPGGSTALGPGRRDQPIATLAVLGAGVGFGALAASSLGSFTTSSFTKAGFGESTAGFIAAIGGVLVITTRLILGFRSDRLNSGVLPIVATMLLIGSSGYALMATMSRSGLLAGGFIAFVAGWGWPGLSNLAIAQANPNGPAAASGVTQTGTYIGAGLGPLVFGSLAEHVGYGAAYLSAALWTLLGATCIVIGRSMLKPVTEVAATSDGVVAI
jgi:MFS family permease